VEGTVHPSAGLDEGDGAFGAQAAEIESNQFQEVLAQQLQERSRACGTYLGLKKVQHTSHKKARIEGIEPRATTPGVCGRPSNAAVA
jgi:hypothetical protein